MYWANVFLSVCVFFPAESSLATIYDQGGNPHGRRPLIKYIDMIFWFSKMALLDICCSIVFLGDYTVHYNRKNLKWKPLFPKLKIRNNSRRSQIFFCLQDSKWNNSSKYSVTDIEFNSPFFVPKNFGFHCKNSESA